MTSSSILLSPPVTPLPAPRCVFPSPHTCRSKSKPARLRAPIRTLLDKELHLLHVRQTLIKQGSSTARAHGNKLPSVSYVYLHKKKVTEWPQQVLISRFFSEPFHFGDDPSCSSETRFSHFLWWTYRSGPSWTDYTSRYLCPPIVPSHIAFEFGHVACFGQWDTSKHGASAVLINTYTLGFIFLEGLLEDHSML